MASLVDKFVGKRTKSQANDAHLNAILGLLSPVQKRFLLSSARLKVARCTRRAGKTYVDAAYLVYECLLNARTPVLYAGLTRDSAKEAIWKLLIQFLDDLSIPHHPVESKLQILFPNGSQITLFGCDQANARHRLRSRKFKLIIFDETGFFTKLDDLVHAVLPMLMDFGGTLCLTSSPGVLLQGLFYDADQGRTKDKWDRYFWSIHENPHFMKPATDPKFATRAEEELDFFLHSQFAGDTKHPEYRREFLGEWVRDEKALVYPIGPANLFQELPSLIREEYALAVNIDHPFIYTILVGRYSEYSPKFQIVDQIDLHDSTMDQLAKAVETLMEKYKTSTVVAHLGGYTHEVADEFRRRYKLPLIASKDRDVSYHQRIYANDLLAGNVQIKIGLLVADEHGKIVKDNLGDEIEGQANHASLAALALHRRIYQTHLSHYEKPLTEEERHIQQLERSGSGEEVEPWYNRG